MSGDSIAVIVVTGLIVLGVLGLGLIVVIDGRQESGSHEHS
jgi:hypothetical protein